MLLLFLRLDSASSGHRAQERIGWQGKDFLWMLCKGSQNAPCAKCCRPDFKVFMSGSELYHFGPKSDPSPLNQLSATLRKRAVGGQCSIPPNTKASLPQSLGILMVYFFLLQRLGLLLCFDGIQVFVFPMPQAIKIPMRHTREQRVTVRLSFGVLMLLTPRSRGILLVLPPFSLIASLFPAGSPDSHRGIFGSLAPPS